MCKRQKILSEMHKKTIVVSARRISVPTKRRTEKMRKFYTWLRFLYVIKYIQYSKKTEESLNVRRSEQQETNGRDGSGAARYHRLPFCGSREAVGVRFFLRRGVTAAACFGQNASLILSNQSAVKIMRLSRSFGFAIPLTYYAKALNFTVLYGHRFFLFPLQWNPSFVRVHFTRLCSF